MTVSLDIKNIIFDLGGVLLNIEPLLTGKALMELGVADMAAVHERLLSSRLYQRFDSGKCSEAEFRHEIREACAIPLTGQEVECAWNALLLDFPEERVEMLHQLKKNYHLFLLSNTNSIHFRSYTKEFRERHGEEFSGLFDKLFLSFEMGTHKPDPEIYQKVLTEGRLKPAETLFIDDSLENAMAAAQMGIHAIHLSEGMEVTGLFQNGKLCPGAELLEVKQ